MAAYAQWFLRGALAAFTLLSLRHLFFFMHDARPLQLLVLA